MKRKRLARDINSWGFGTSPYYQFQLDCDDFHGLVGMIRLTGMEPQYWTSPCAGRYPVSGHGMQWLQLVPDDAHHVVTVMIKPEPKTVGGILYRHSISAWYVDVIETLDFDEDGVAAFLDKYLNVIATPEGEVKIDDRDELDAAYASGELSREQYLAALHEGDVILNELCADIPASEELYMKLFTHAEQRISDGMEPMKKQNRLTER